MIKRRSGLIFSVEGRYWIGILYLCPHCQQGFPLHVNLLHNMHNYVVLSNFKYLFKCSPYLRQKNPRLTNHLLNGASVKKLTDGIFVGPNMRPRKHSPSIMDEMDICFLVDFCLKAFEATNGRPSCCRICQIFDVPVAPPRRPQYHQKWEAKLP